MLFAFLMLVLFFANSVTSNGTVLIRLSKVNETPNAHRYLSRTCRLGSVVGTVLVLPNFCTRTS
jgi:hypothetical protein